METREKLELAFKLLREVVDETGVNLIDNYGYRELTSIQCLKEYLPSAVKTIGRTGDDASAINEGYYHIEKKSGTSKGKTLTIKGFAKLEFDKQNDPARREDIFRYDGLSISFFEFYKPYPTVVVFVTKDQVKKLHPLMKEKQIEAVKGFEAKSKLGQKIGRDSIYISLKEILNNIKEEDLICWFNESRIDGKELFAKIRNGEIKINQ